MMACMEVMEKKMETIIMEKHLEKNMENETQTGIIMGYIQGLCRD